MAEMDEDFVDIQDKKKVFLVKEDIEFIRENPKGLTKEGCAERIKSWENSTNRYVLAKYRVMLKKCEKFTNSGKTVDGKVVLSRGKDGKIKWVGEEKKEE